MQRRTQNVAEEAEVMLRREADVLRRRTSEAGPLKRMSYLIMWVTSGGKWISLDLRLLLYKLLESESLQANTLLFFFKCVFIWLWTGRRAHLVGSVCVSRCWVLVTFGKIVLKLHVRKINLSESRTILKLGGVESEKQDADLISSVWLWRLPSLSSWRTVCLSA